MSTMESTISVMEQLSEDNLLKVLEFAERTLSIQKEAAPAQRKTRAQILLEQKTAKEQSEQEDSKNAKTASGKHRKK